jgi:hypothetical protein
MDYKLRDVIDSLDYNELVRMKKDLEYGGFHLKSFIVKKLHEKERKHAEPCSVCSAELREISVNNFTLVFGPEDFRKKASFCGMDCLEYFLKDLKQMKGVR